jgi:hypothetical protein
MVLKSVGVLSVAKVFAILYGVFGLIVGAVVSLIAFLGAVGSAMGANGPEGAAGMVFGLIFGAGGIIVLPIVYAAMGFVGGLIGAWLYNVVAGMVGGVELRLE